MPHRNSTRAARPSPCALPAPVLHRPQVAPKSGVKGEKADPIDDGSVGSPLSGVVVSLKVEKGDTVEKGQALAVMSVRSCPAALCWLAVVLGMLLHAVCRAFQRNCAQSLLAPKIGMPSFSALLRRVCRR